MERRKTIFVFGAVFALIFAMMAGVALAHARDTNSGPYSQSLTNLDDNRIGTLKEKVVDTVKRAKVAVFKAGSDLAGYVKNMVVDIGVNHYGINREEIKSLVDLNNDTYVDMLDFEIYESMEPMNKAQLVDSIAKEAKNLSIIEMLVLEEIAGHMQAGNYKAAMASVNHYGINEEGIK